MLNQLVRNGIPTVKSLSGRISNFITRIYQLRSGILQYAHVNVIEKPYLDAALIY
jgi:hypothetical protein